MDLGVDWECPWCHLYFWQRCWWRTRTDAFMSFFFLRFVELGNKKSFRTHYIYIKVSNDFRVNQRCSCWVCLMLCVQTYEQRLQRDNTSFSLLCKVPFKKRSSCISGISVAGVPGAYLALIYSSKTSECLSIISAVHWLFGVESPVRKHALEC